MDEIRIPKGDIGEKIQIPVCRKTVNVAFSTDYNLADYQVPIKRLLHLSVNVLSPMQYISGNSADLSGDIEYTALYVGDDNQLYTISIKDEYSTTVALDKANEIPPNSPIDLYARFNPTSVTSRVTAPKKLNIKASLSGDISAYGNIEHRETISGEANAESIERLIVPVRCANILHGKSETFMVNQRIPLEIKSLDEDKTVDMRIVGVYSSPHITNVDSADGVALCRGDLYIKVYTCCDENGDIKVQSSKVPFTCEVNVESLDDDYDCCAYGECVAVGVTIDENDINISVPVNVNISAMNNKIVKTVSDAYSTDCPCEASFKTYNTINGLCAINGNFTMSGNVPLSDIAKPGGDSITADDKIFDSFVTLVVESVIYDKGKYMVSGKSVWTVIFSNEEEYKIVLVEMPFKYEIEGQEQTPDMYDFILRALNTRARIEDDRLLLDAEIAVCGTLYGNNEINMLDELNFDGEYNDNEAGYTVYFPDGSDTLWKVGKKYHKPLRRIINANNLLGNINSDDKKSLDGVNYLVV